MPNQLTATIDIKDLENIMLLINGLVAANTLLNDQLRLTNERITALSEHVHSIGNLIQSKPGVTELDVLVRQIMKEIKNVSN